MSSCKYALPVLVLIATLLLPSANAVYTWINKGTTSQPPGARYGAASWVDNTGTLWMFAGATKDNATSSTESYLNSLYSYSMANNQWTLVSGSTSTNKVGMYPSATGGSGQPGGRKFATRWADASGNLWLFGGIGLGNGSNEGMLNDLWKYNIASKTWTWVAGNAAAGVAQTSSSSPSPRSGAASWMDTSGNVYLFGGNGFPMNSTDSAILSDTWYFSTTKGSWSMVTTTGSNPTARAFAASWTDASGNGWIYGGSSSTATLNDLWTFKSSAWTQVYGSSNGNQLANYPAGGLDATGGNPGALSGASSWAGRTNGEIYLFGGMGFDNTSTSNYQRDLWKFNTTSSAWTWVYGTPSAGKSGSTVDPGARMYACSWRDNDGNVILFGGYGYDINGSTKSILGDTWVHLLTTTAATTGSMATSNATGSSLTSGGMTTTGASSTSGGGATTVTQAVVTVNLGMSGDPSAVNTASIGNSVASALGLNPANVNVTIKLNNKRVVNQNFTVIITVIFPNASAAAATAPGGSSSAAGNTTASLSVLSNFVQSTVTNNSAVTSVFKDAGLTVTSVAVTAAPKVVTVSTTGTTAAGTTTPATTGSTTKQSGAIAVAPQGWFAVAFAIVVCVSTLFW